MHESVMVHEIVHYCETKRGGIIVDGTLGSGGHSKAILDALEGKVTIVGLDQDRDAIQRSLDRLQAYKEQVHIVQSNFDLLDTVLDTLGIQTIDACIFDLGVSSDQIDTPERGFSFLSEGPLDMRMNQSQGYTAADLVNTLPEEELARIIFEYGEDRHSRRIARACIRAREKKQFERTSELAEVIERACGGRRGARIHPATRTFQALRIAVNHELDALRNGLEKAQMRLAKHGLLCVISFHSLEDRIVKHTFRRWSDEGRVNIITKKPLYPSEDECKQNIRARSAKLRIAERSSTT